MCRAAKMKQIWLSLSVVLSVWYLRSASAYSVPAAKLEFGSSKGLKISIPNTSKDISLVAFHVNINEQFKGVEHGQWAADIHSTENGRWSYYIPNVKVKKGDSVYYWIYVLKDGKGYQALRKRYTKK